ncbi:MAG TPA: glycerol-3-phosphate dehydrogenase/oxidase [Pyrinomonadaceae bacterium]|nr:glycerol-3-phosphate dehydrogenase/oxidase [Pyrinomonadaceae bacterium]
MPSEIHPQFDVIVIGAGINGAGIARDAAMRGLKVLVLDKGDIGGGTSSWSTRLIHGGLRYLEHGEFGLVRESLRERACLMKIAAHLVRPLAMLVPVYEQARRGWWTIRAGMIAYDLLSFDKRLPRHQMLSRAETLERAPGINPAGLLGAAVYFDAQVEFAERLVVENVLSAVEHGAEVITYARVNQLLVESGKVRGVEFTTTEVQSPTSKVQSPLIHETADTGTAGVSLAERGVHSTVSTPCNRHSATAQVVVNAAGPWIDELLAQTTTANSPRLIGGTKGSHIIVRPFGATPATAIYVEAETDGRPFFIIPWNGNLLVGTTDSRYRGDLDRVRIDDEELDYLLRETNRVIPHANLTRAQVLYTYSGVRPLPFSENDDEPSITRRHFIRRHPQLNNLLSIVGGKLTTYRSLAEEVVDLVLRERGSTSTQCATDRTPLPGAASDLEAFSKDFRRSSGLSEATSNHLLRVYGRRAPLVMDLVARDARLGEVFDEETGAIAAEIVFAFEQEFAETLADCLLRRTMVGLNSSAGLNAVAAAAKIAQEQLGWSADRAAREIAQYRKHVSRGFCARQEAR